MTRRHLQFRWAGRLGARFQWERRVLRDRIGVIWVTYVLKAWGAAGYRAVSVSLSPRKTRSEWALHVRELRAQLRYLLARDGEVGYASQLVTPCSPMLVSPDAGGMAYAGIDAGPHFTDDRPCSTTKPSR